MAAIPKIEYKLVATGPPWWKQLFSKERLQGWWHLGFQNWKNEIITTWIHKTWKWKGFILRPVLYALYVSPLQDLTEIDMFTNDNYPIETGKNIAEIKIAESKSN